MSGRHGSSNPKTLGVGSSLSTAPPGVWPWLALATAELLAPVSSVLLLGGWCSLVVVVVVVLVVDKCPDPASSNSIFFADLAFLERKNSEISFCAMSVSCVVVRHVKSSRLKTNNKLFFHIFFIFLPLSKIMYYIVLNYHFNNNI